jgi:hypothetical protein
MQEYPGSVRGALALAVLAAALVGCGSESSAGPGDGTSLTVTYWPRGPEGGAKQTWTLRCDPAGGSLPRPAAACRKLATDPALLAEPVPPSTVCAQIYGGPQTARVTGKVDGEQVSAAFSRTNGCEIPRWDTLSPWLLPRGGVI